jgi:hypothetical protein
MRALQTAVEEQQRLYTHQTQKLRVCQQQGMVASENVHSIVAPLQNTCKFKY